MNRKNYRMAPFENTRKKANDKIYLREEIIKDLVNSYERVINDHNINEVIKNHTKFIRKRINISKKNEYWTIKYLKNYKLNPNKNFALVILENSLNNKKLFSKFNSY